MLKKPVKFVFWIGATLLSLLITSCEWRTLYSESETFPHFSDSVHAPLANQPAAATVRFAVIGDFGEDSSDEAAVAELVASWSPDFVATVGDNNYPNGAASTIDANIGKYYHQFISPYIGSFGAGANGENRFFPALGNHDWGSLKCSSNTCSGAHFDYFVLPNNERYYDVVKGPLHLFVVDSDSSEPDGIKSDSRQAAWLRTQLAESTASWQVVTMHHPPYSSSSKHGSTTELQWPYKNWGADAVLAGHDHTYERITVNSFPYFVNGLGGKSIYPFGTPIAGSEVRYNAQHGAMLIEATETSLTFKFINVAGETIDSYTLTQSPTALIPNRQNFLPLVVR
jgi:hypothetical protein